MGLKCLFKRHEFKRFWDQPMGSLIFRHVKCKICDSWYSFLWVIDKEERSHIKMLRMKHDRNWS